MISEKDLKFLRQRKKLVKFWPILGVVVSVVFVVLFIGLSVKAPLIINPYYTAERLEAGQLDTVTLHLFALLCPLSFLFLFTSVGILLISLWGWIRLEKKYLSIVDELVARK